MRKLFLILFSCLFFGCLAPKVEAPDYRPKITLESKDGNVYVSASYFGRDWVFLSGVEFRNASGDVRKVIFNNVKSEVVNYKLVSEFGFFWVAFGDKFLEWCGDDVQARPLSERGFYDFEPLAITYGD